MLLRACRINQFKVAPRDQRLHGFGRPTAAVSIHVCVSENINSGLHLRVKGNKNLADQLQLHPRIKGYKGLADQVRLGAYTCVSRNLSIQSCTQVRHVWPTSCCCEHTHVCCRIRQFRPAPNIPRFYKAFADEVLLQATASTHARCRISQLRAAPKDHRLRRFGRPTAAASIHTCIAEITQGSKL